MILLLLSGCPPAVCNNVSARIVVVALSVVLVFCSWPFKHEDNRYIPHNFVDLSGGALGIDIFMLLSCGIMIFWLMLERCSFFLNYPLCIKIKCISLSLYFR